MTLIIFMKSFLIKARFTKWMCASKKNFALTLLCFFIRISATALAVDVCNCVGDTGPGGECYAGLGGPAYAGIGGPCNADIGGPRNADPGGPANADPGGPCYAGAGGPCYSTTGTQPVSCPEVCAPKRNPDGSLFEESRPSLFSTLKSFFSRLF